VGSIAIGLAKKAKIWVGCVCRPSQESFVSGLGVNIVVSQDQKWHESRDLGNIDVVFDAVGNPELASKANMVLNAGGKFVTIGSPVSTTSSVELGHCMVSNPSQLNEIAQNYLEGSIKFQFAARHEFTAAGLRSFFQSEDDTGKHILRVFPYSCYLYINLTMISSDVNEATRILQNYTSTTQYNSGNIFCAFHKSGNDTENFVIAEMWRNMTALKAHLCSHQYEMLSQKCNTTLEINSTKILRDILDGFVLINKLPSNPANVKNLYRAYVMATVAPQRKQDFMSLVKKTLKRSKAIPGCQYFSVAQEVLPDDDDSNNFMAFWIFTNEAAYVAYRNNPDTVAYVAEYKSLATTMTFEIPALRRMVSY